MKNKKKLKKLNYSDKKIKTILIDEKYRNDEAYNKNYSTVIINHNYDPIPKCIHGKCCLFERKTKEIGFFEKKTFFACSVYRNRKKCRFYLTLEDYLTKIQKCTFNDFQSRQLKLESIKSENLITDINENLIVDIKNRIKESRKELENDKIKAIKAIKEKTKLLVLCLKCYRLSESLVICDKCQLKLNESNIVVANQEFFQTPYNYIKSLSDNKGNAQYLFNDEAIGVIMDFAINTIKFEKLVCIGTPTIHVYGKRNGLDSILLDIDLRYESIYPDSFIHFNMSTSEFVDKTSIEMMENFVNKIDNNSKVLLIIDPPFGLHPLLLSQMIDNLSNFFNNSKKIPFLLAWPYYQKSALEKSEQDIIMLDYRIGYLNHKSFINSQNGSPITSPVRLFLGNYSNQLKDLIIKNGGIRFEIYDKNLMNSKKLKKQLSICYKFCSSCKMDRHESNFHCDKCNTCTTIHGKQYHHCDICSKCVKFRMLHCDKCNKCHDNRDCFNISEKKCF